MRAWPAGGDRHHDGIAAYASQVRGLGSLLDDAYAPERCWKMMRR